MELFLKEIEKAIDSGLYHIALQATLTLPDICAALMSPSGKTSKEKYIRWYDTHVKQPGDYLSSEDCYYYRCSCVHQSRAQHEKTAYSRIMFMPPNNCMVAHNCIIFDTLNVDLLIFCGTIINAVRSWQDQVKDDPIYIANHEKLIRFYPNGFSNYIVGLPVIT